MKNQSKKIKATYIILLLAVIVISLGAFCTGAHDYMDLLIGVYLFPVAMVMCTGGIIIGTTSWKQMLIYLVISMLFCFYVILLDKRFIIAHYDNIFIGIVGVVLNNLKGDLSSILIFSNGMITAVIGEVIGKVGNIIYKNVKEKSK